MFDFWKRYRGSGFHHEDDTSNIDNVSWKVHEDDNHRFAFHKNLLPVPYVGNPTKANILILMLNPGYSPILSYPEESSDNKMVHMLKKNLQNDVDICWWLSEEWKDSGAGLYWRKAFGKIANELKKINGYSSLEESFSLLSQNIAIIQLVPYHSQKMKMTKHVRNLKSSSIIREYVHEIKKSSKLLVVRRGRKEYGLEEAENIVTDGHPISPVFNNSEPKRIIERLTPHSM